MLREWGLVSKPPQVSIPRGEVLPVSLLQQQENFPISTSHPSGPKEALGAGIVGSGWAGQSPLPNSSPCRAPRVILGRLCPELKVFLVPA